MAESDAVWAARSSHPCRGRDRLECREFHRYRKPGRTGGTGGRLRAQRYPGHERERERRDDDDAYGPRACGNGEPAATRRRRAVDAAVARAAGTEAGSLPTLLIQPNIDGDRVTAQRFVAWGWRKAVQITGNTDRRCKPKHEPGNRDIERDKTRVCAAETTE